MRIILLSDIHANLTALRAVTADFTARYEYDAIALLGDIVNYGMRPNEVIELLERHAAEITVDLFGNHENALFDGDLHKFSTERGKRLLDYTRSQLNGHSMAWLESRINRAGFETREIGGKSFLFIHGSIDDPYWGKLNADTIDGRYAGFDYVISGHSHIPHLIERFFPCDNPAYRDRKRTIFINPGSVGQPRNHNPRAQYAYIDTDSETFHLNAVSYDIQAEQTLYPPQLDQFYKTRLTNGI